MITPRDILFGTALPFAVALAVTMLGAKRWPRASVGAALALAYIGAHTGLAGLPKFTPAPVEQWLPFIALAGLIVGLIEARAKAPLWARTLWRAAAVGGSCWLIVRVKSINGQWTPTEAALCTAAVSVATLILWSALGALVSRLHSTNARAWHSVLPLALVTGFGSLLILLNGHSLTVAQLAGALSMALFAIAAASLRAQAATLTPAGVAVVALLASMLWLDAALWTALSDWYALAIAVAPLAALAAVSLPPTRNLRPWIRALVASGAGALPLLPLVGLEIARVIAEQQSGSDAAY